MRKIDMAGKRYGYWTVKEMLGAGKVLAVCDCGTEKEVTACNLRNGRSKSCGCHRVESGRITGLQNKTHGLSSHLLYDTWKNMVGRCYDPEHVSYKDYGAKGVRVCAVWRTTPTAFISWAKAKGLEPGLEVDRIDTFADYSPTNCRVVTRDVNAANKGVSRINTSGFTGVHYKQRRGRFIAYIQAKTLKAGLIRLGYFKTALEAVTARDEFILKHNLPHRVQVLEVPNV